MLTDRERQILQLIADGETYKVAAEDLGIAEATIKNHLYNIRFKLLAESTPQAVGLAIRHGEIK